MTRHRLRRSLGPWVAIAALLCVGCSVGTPTSPGATPEPAPSSDAPLADTRWSLTELAGEPLVANTVVTAAFGADGTVTGTAGCNRYRTTYETSDTTITIAATGAMTMMACPEPVMEQERAFLDSLGAAATFAVTPDTLTLTNEAGTTVLTFALQAQELVGSWEVIGYNNDQSAVVSVVEGTDPVFEFTDDQVSGTAGCNQLSGTYSVDGATVEIGPLIGTKMACLEPDGVMEQEAALSAALEAAATFSIEGDTLEMRRADDQIAVQFRRH